MNGSQKTIPPLRVPLWVDVRNVALAHVLALEKEAAKNQRYFLVAGSFSFKEITDYLLKTFPELKGKVPTELTAPEPTAAELFGADHSKSVKDLGIEYIGLEQTIYDLGKQLVDWVK